MQTLKQKHEAILSFINENINQLVKLKLLTVAKLKKYDEAYKDFLAASENKDTVKVMSHGDQMENFRLQLLEKLFEDIRSNTKFAQNTLVAQYGMVLNGWDDDDIKYVDFFDDNDEVAIMKLVDAILYLSHEEDEEIEDKMDKMPLDELLKKLGHRFYDCTAEWIDDLTYSDLMLLRELCDDEEGRVETANTPIELISQKLNFVDESDDEFIIYPDIRNTIEPFLDDAIADKIKNHEPFLEQLFIGLLNICGMLMEDEMSRLMKSFVKKSRKPLTDNDVDRFLAHTMLVRICRMWSVCSPNKLISRLIEPGWELDVRNEYEMYIPKSLDEVLARGSYPYLKPFSKEEKALYDLMRDKVGKYDADSLYTYFYCKVQDPEEDFKDVISDFVDTLELENINEVQRCTAKFFNFYNNIPKLILKGNPTNSKP